MNRTSIIILTVLSSTVEL